MVVVEEIIMTKLAKSEFRISEDPTRVVNPWNVKPTNTKPTDTREFISLVNKCRFFYKKDPLTSTTINKLVEIGINDLTFSKNGLSDNEFRVFTGMEHDLLLFAEDMALEFLISGLVVPEVK